MTEELTQHKMVVDQEEGEILEDGEIADDEDDIVAIGNHSPNQGTAIKDEKENKESNKSKFGSFSSYYPVDRDDHFKQSNKRKKKNNSKKRKRSNSNELKRKPGDLITNHNLVDVSPYINDPSYDSVELSDEDDYNFDLVPFDVLMEILGCTVGKELVENVLPFEKQNLMLRIVKIMKRQHGQDPDTSRRFARLKRRARERPNSNSNPGTKAVYKAICKFYLEGKCHKGSECYFSHDCVVPKRKELCKFYLQGFCGKGDDCLFMHGEFPCKFFHTNTECYSGDKCRFSHSPLTEETREILRSYLDSGTLPDDPKPFRSHYSDWSNSNKNYNNNNNNELNDDSADFDTSFNYETEQLLSRTRPVLLGEPTQKMKVSYETWNWQQELKDLEKAYTGLKKNLFCIDEIFAITEKPPTPRIEDDEEEVEAQIMNYYNDMLDTDEMDEMLALQEIEEHQKKVKEEVQIVKDNVNDTPVFKENVLSEEEKRLIEASAHDEDLRVIPGLAAAGPFASAPAISSVFDQVSFNPPSSYFSNNDNYSQANSFNDSSNTLPLDNKVDTIPNYPEFGSPFAKQSNELTASDVSNMVRQIRNGTMTETTQGATASKPEYRDPRLNRLKEMNRMQNNVTSNNSQPSFVAAAEEKPISKPFFKVLNPNVIVEYKMASLKISIINYSSYFEYYQNDNALKNDPRLKKFFSSPMVDQKPANDLDYAFPKSNTDSEGLMPLPSLNIPQIKKATTIVSPPVPSKILSPLELISSKVKDNEASTSPTLSRDPRIRSKEVERRRNSDSKLDEQTKSPTAEEKSDHVEIATEDIPVIKHEATNSESPVKESATDDNSPDSANNLSSIPSYAMAALSSTRSLFSSVNNNLLFSNFNSTEKPANNQSPLITNENSYSGDSNTIDDDDDILENNALLVDEDDGLKVDLDQTETETETEPKCSKEEGVATDTNTWPLNVTNNSIDSDNEMEIDLQHHESEVDSENENELIIASSSEPEDNKDCDSQNNDPVTISDYSVNC